MKTLSCMSGGKANAWSFFGCQNPDRILPTLVLVFSMALTCSTARAQEIDQSSAARGSAGGSGFTDGKGSDARFYYPSGTAVDLAGNVYVADGGNSIIRKITPRTVVTTIAGKPRVSGGADGMGSEARFSFPYAIAVDLSGNLYVADSGNFTIRKISPNGNVTTLAGKAGIPGSTDGSGETARFAGPRGIAVDASGNLYVGDSQNNVIRKITSDGTVSTFAGTAGKGGNADGQAANAGFRFPCGVAVDGQGNVYVADYDNSTIRKITAGLVSTLAGESRIRGHTDGEGIRARFNKPDGVAVDGSGNLYVGDSFNDDIRKVNPNGVVTTVAGKPTVNGSADGKGHAAQFFFPRGVAVRGAGDIYIADSNNHTIRKMTPSGVVTTFAGKALD